MSKAYDFKYSGEVTDLATDNIVQFIYGCPSKRPSDLNESDSYLPFLRSSLHLGQVGSTCTLFSLFIAMEMEEKVNAAEGRQT